MGMFDRLAGLASTLITFEVQLRQLREDFSTNRAELHALRDDVTRLSERVTRLEVQREADRAEWNARFAECQAHLNERLAEMESSRKPQKQRARPKKK